MPFPNSLKYKVLTTKNAKYDAEYWERLKAFYCGGKDLLESKSLMLRVFPQHIAEEAFVYAERQKRAVYINYAGELVDYLVAGLSTDPIKVGVGENKQVPGFYREFFEDVSPPGGDRQDLNTFVRQQTLNALIYGRAWTLVDLPLVDSEFSSLSDQEQSGVLRAYLQSIDPFTVFDWEKDAFGELNWIILVDQSCPRTSISEGRDTIFETFTVYTRSEWAKYQISYKKDKKPKENDEVKLVATSEHSFGAVPVIPMELPEGMWAMNKLENLSRDHFNARSALSWAQRKSLIPVLYEFLGDELSEGTGEAGEDPNRAINQPRGIGRVQIRGGTDRAEYIGPSAAPFENALKTIKDLRDEMHRVLYAMSLAEENSPTTMRRSGESKAHDRAAMAVILQTLGRHVRRHIRRVYTLVAKGRADTPQDWSVSGMASFDVTPTSLAIREGMELEQVSIPSPHFRKMQKLDLAKRVLGEAASAEDHEIIRTELDTNITDETVRAAEVEEQQDTDNKPQED